ncbi:hypothetical protein BD626DRAFT_501756 [Schizophyllum amplum]|uniref:Uncharacterized protein n=1 Tax=Schizophyllum amplum TaxID=97359 RepID=A0A550CA30_9AGAR|nr:hypothetical protein BD626DRAFT_501756 [Auriculariopsis ampla]
MSSSVTRFKGKSRARLAEVLPLIRRCRSRVSLCRRTPSYTVSIPASIFISTSTTQHDPRHHVSAGWVLRTIYTQVELGEIAPVIVVLAETRKQNHGFFNVAPEVLCIVVSVTDRLFERRLGVNNNDQLKPCVHARDMLLADVRPQVIFVFLCIVKILH